MKPTRLEEPVSLVEPVKLLDPIRLLVVRAVKEFRQKIENN